VFVLFSFACFAFYTIIPLPAGGDSCRKEENKKVTFLGIGIEQSRCESETERIDLNFVCLLCIYFRKGFKESKISWSIQIQQIIQSRFGSPTIRIEKKESAFNELQLSLCCASEFKWSENGKFIIAAVTSLVGTIKARSKSLISLVSLSNWATQNATTESAAAAAAIDTEFIAALSKSSTSLPPAFANNLKQQQQQQQSPIKMKSEQVNRDYILTPETPDREDHFEMEMDEPLNLSKKCNKSNRDCDISSTHSHGDVLPQTPKHLNANLFSAIWSPASLVSHHNEKSFGIKSESIESSPSTPVLKFNFENIRNSSSIKSESGSEQMDFENLKKNCSNLLMMSNNNNNNLAYNNNNIINSSFNASSETSEKVAKPSRRSLPIIKPDSTENKDFFVREFRDERSGKKERSFEVSKANCVNRIVSWSTRIRMKDNRQTSDINN